MGPTAPREGDAVTTGTRPSDPWPAFSYSAFEPTRHLLHMVLQAVGKLGLAKPFQAQWAEVPLWLTARGLTTGPIPDAGGVYEVRIDLIAHEVQWLTSAGVSGQLPLGPYIRGDVRRHVPRPAP